MSEAESILPDAPFAVPSMLDPRLALMLPVAVRPALEALWRLDARLFDVVILRREDMLAQLKLAWWRDRLEQVSANPAALPRGEPLLAALASYWAGTAALTGFADGYEAAMLATSADEARAAAAALASAMQRPLATLGMDALPMAWALVRAGQMAADKELAQQMWVDAGAVAAADEMPRAARTLDRWARLVARHKGAAPPRAEGWLLLRAGLGW